jgi:hypothetical protein
MNSGEIIAIAIGAVALIAIFLFSGGMQSISGSKTASTESAQSTQSGGNPSASGGSLIVETTYNLTNENQYEYTNAPTYVYSPTVKPANPSLVGIGTGNTFLPPVYFPK